MTPIDAAVQCDSNEPRLYTQVARYVRETPWAIRPEMLSVIHELVALRGRGERLTPDEIHERIGDGAGARHAQLVERLARLSSPNRLLEADPVARAQVDAQMERAAAARSAGYVAGTVAVLPLYGVIMPRATIMSQYSGGTSVQDFVGALQAAVANDTVASVLIDIDSPGGSTDLIPEAAAAIRDARGSKPIEAIANCDACSAAYWLGSQADNFWVTPSGVVGSIGVFMEHDDWSGALEQQGVKVTLISAGPYKTEGNPYEPLGPEALAAFQSMVDDFHGLFVSDVAQGRDTTAEAVRAGYGQGRVLTAGAAVDGNLVDGIDTFDSVFGRLARGGRTTKTGRGALVDIGPTTATATSADFGWGVLESSELKAELDLDTEAGSDKPVMHDPAASDEHDPWVLAQALNEHLTKEN